jgi:long-chain acyl-CoA synthetase
VPSAAGQSPQKTTVLPVGKNEALRLTMNATGLAATAWLFERIRSTPDDIALIWHDAATTYRDLDRLVSYWHIQLRELGTTRGQVLAIDGSFSPKVCALLLALLESGGIAVPLTRTVAVNRASYLEIAQACACVTFGDSDDWSVETISQASSHPLYEELERRQHPGLVIFSSGSTGRPKAIVHDFAALLEKFREPRTKKRTLAFLLFDHIGGIDTLFNAFSSAGTLVVPEKRDPCSVCKAIARHRVHTLPASPSFLNLLLVSEAWNEYDLSSLRVIAYGAEAMPASTLLRLNQLLPTVALVQTYGMSELGVIRSSSKDSTSLLLKFRDEAIDVKVVDGVLWVRTTTAMLGYLNAPDDIVDADGWLNTQDAVQVEGDYIRVCGRVTDIINVGGQKVFPLEVEDVILRLDNVSDVTVCGEPNPLLGQIVVAVVKLAKPEPFEQFKRRLRAFCRERLAGYQIPVRIEVRDQELFGSRFKKVRRE